MFRKATADIHLSDGLFIRQGQRVVIDTLDAAASTEDNKFDLFRFTRMRDDPKHAKQAPLTSTSPEHLGFGYGQSACLGRFYAANQIKVLLCHLLLKYDWKLAPGSETSPVAEWLYWSGNPRAKLMYRRRNEEIELD